MSSISVSASVIALVVLATACANQQSKDATAEKVAPAKASDDLSKRQYRFTYSVTVPAAPAGTKAVEVWVPLAAEDPGVQQVADLKIEAPAGHRVTTDPELGNKMIYCKLENATAPTRIVWSATVTRFEDRGQGSLATSPRYLKADSLVPIDGKAREMAEQLGVADTSMSLHERAKKIYDDVLTGMTYDKNHTGWGNGDFNHAITVCKGNCTDFHARFIGIGRAAGIPVRFTMGIPFKTDKKGEYNSYHCWAHYYDGKNWHPVDISEADKVADKDPAKAQWFFRHLDDDRISLTFGRDVTLVPRHQGKPLNYFVFPYAEADGVPMKLSKDENWKFAYEDVE